MASTYTASNVGTVVKDWMRLTLMDTESPWLFDDAEITAVIGLYDDIRTAVYQLARSAYLKVSKRADKASIGDEKKEFSERAKAYLALMDDAANMPIPEAFGGTAISSQRPVSGSITKPDLTDFSTT